VPFLKGTAHPMGKRLVDCQPCFRAEDITEIGDDRHTTFFEMLGNWSLGDYFKKEQLYWFYDFLTDKVGLDPNKLYVTVFEGNKDVPGDKESIKIWQQLFKTQILAKRGIDGFNKNIKIYSYDATKNWWSRSGAPDNMPAGEIGGPDSEVFYDFGENLKSHENSRFKDKPCHVNCDCGRFLEIGNSVFMEYEKQADGSFKPLPAKNVDFGGGLERIAAAKKGNPDIFKTDLFWPIIEVIDSITGKRYVDPNKESMRVIADHLKAAVFMILQDVEPSNKAQGYILRRLLRRAAIKARHLTGLMTPIKDFQLVAHKVIDIYEKPYFSQKEKAIKQVDQILEIEMSKFAKTLDKGLKEIQKTSLEKIDAKFAFDLFQTYGFPFEITNELLVKKGKILSRLEFQAEFDKHQQLSRTTSKGMFKGGLADHSQKITQYHTATHLLHAALRKVLGNQVQQVGSNITGERLRFDFTHSDKLTDEQITEIEKIVGKQIENNLKISFQNMPLSEAQKKGALAFFGQKYPETVKVYTIGDKDGMFSVEVCAGPHVDFTGVLGNFKIIKQEAIGAGKRRIYAVLN